MSGKGSADTRTPNYEARARTYERIAETKRLKEEAKKNKPYYRISFSPEEDEDLFVDS